MFDGQIPTAYVEVIKTLSLFHVEFDLNNDVRKKTIIIFFYICV